MAQKNLTTRKQLTAFLNNQEIYLYIAAITSKLQKWKVEIKHENKPWNVAFALCMDACITLFRIIKFSLPIS